MKNLEDTFKRIVPILNLFKIKYWADYGTLLGIVRDGGIIKGDNDLDFSFPIDQLPVIASLKSVFKDNDIELKLKREGHHKLLFPYLGSKITSTDLFYWYKDGQKLYRKHYVYGYEQGSTISTDFINTLGSIRIWGLDVKIPGNVEKFLELRYGDWKTPKPKSKDGYENNKNKRPNLSGRDKYFY